MLPEARRRNILSHIAQVGSATINNLGKQYHVSNMTIRRDLKLLQEAGYITLTHGGAIYNDDSFQRKELHHAERATANADEKRAIGSYVAAHLIDNGDVLFLDSGTTVRAIIPFLRDELNLTITSNSHKTIESLYRYLPNSDILTTGGLLNPTAMTFVGPVAEGFFDNFFARKAFVSGVGLSIQAGLTDSQLLDTVVKKAMIRSAEQTIVLIDSSKIGHTATAQVLTTEQIQTVVTDEGIDDDLRKEMIDLGIDVHVVPL